MATSSKPDRARTGRVPAPRAGALLPRGLLAVALVGLAAAPAARAGDDRPQQGVDLALALLAARDQAQADRLVARAGKLGRQARAALCAWAVAHAREERTARLVPALLALGEAETLARLARAVTDGPGPARAALEAIVQLPPAQAAPILVAGLDDPQRDVASSHQGALVACLARSPQGADEPLRPFAEVARQRLDELRDPDEAARRARLERALANAVSLALVRRDEVEPMLREGLALTEAPAAVRLGLLEGIVPRLAHQSRELRTIRVREEQRRAKLEGVERMGLIDLDAFMQEQLDRSPRLRRLQDAVAEERRLYAAAVAKVCGEAQDPATITAGLAALPQLIDALSPGWAELLIGLLDHARREVRDAAFKALRTLSGQELQQNRVVWERWWTAQQARGE